MSDVSNPPGEPRSVGRPTPLPSLALLLLVVIAFLVLGGPRIATDYLARLGPQPSPGPGGEPILIRTRLTVAATSGSEPIATGEIVDGSTLGDSAFCTGGTILDSHASLDPGMEPYGLIDRRITCPDGAVRMGFTPDLATDTGSWTIVSGSGAFEALRGSGTFEVVYDPTDESLALETYSGMVTR